MLQYLSSNFKPLLNNVLSATQFCTLLQSGTDHLLY